MDTVEPLTTPQQPSPVAERVLYEGNEYSVMDDIIPAVRETDKPFEYTLPYGYTLSYQRDNVFLENDRESMVESKVILLKKNGVLLQKLYIPPHHTDSKGLLFEDIRPCLLEHEGLSATEWMKKKFAPENPADQAPWERTEPSRIIKVPRPLGTDDIREMSLSLNDEGNARRFAEEVGDDIIFDIVESKPGKYDYIPYVWTNDNHYEQSEKNLNTAVRNVMNTIGTHELPAWEAAYDKEAALGEDANQTILAVLKKLIERLQNHAVNSGNWVSQKHMIELFSKSENQVSLMDISDYNIIACKNGAFNTKTGTFTPLWDCAALKKRRPTVFIERTYIPGAVPAKFLNHLLTVFTDNTTEGLSDDEREGRAVEMTEYFLNLLGYMMLAGNPRQIFVFLYGDGANGKSATVDILAAVLGKERANAPINEIYADADDKKPHIAKGLQRRLLTISEASAGGGRHKISLNDVRRISGEKSADDYRRMYVESRETPINCLPVGITNDKPEFDGALDYSAIRRLVLIRFPHRFEANERRPEVIEEIIACEADEIFSFLLSYALKVNECGLPEMPVVCEDAGRVFLAGEPYSTFVTSNYEPTNEVGEEFREEKSMIVLSYIAWCDSHGYPVDRKKKLISVNNYNDPGYDLDLSRKERDNLWNAFEAHGFKKITIKGKECYRCRRIVRK